MTAIKTTKTKHPLPLLALILALTPCQLFAKGDTIKVGVLHSLSGTMALSETTLKDTVLMLIEAQNKKGGLLGKPLEAVVVDPASKWSLYATKAQELLEKHHVATIFGGWTSVSRKAALPVLEKLNGLMFYPVQYEGEESSRNIFYTGAAPNQQALPSVDYLMKERGVKRWILVGTDYVYPRTTNKILKEYLLAQGVNAEDIVVQYTPFGHSDWETIVSNIQVLGTTGKKLAVISTINGDANVSFYKELSKQHINSREIPVVAFSVGEQELSTTDTRNLVGHLAAWNYFMSETSKENEAFIKQWHEYTKDPKRVTNDPMEATMIGFNMWIKAVEEAKTTEVDQVIDTLIGIKVPNLTGGTAIMLKNHHITKPVLLGEIQADGQFKTIWRTKNEIAGDAWSNYLTDSKNLISDWTKPIDCGNYDQVAKRCKTGSFLDWLNKRIF